jgi:hypothetical protein
MFVVRFARSLLFADKILLKENLGLHLDFVAWVYSNVDSRSLDFDESKLDSKDASFLNYAIFLDKSQKDNIEK